MLARCFEEASISTTGIVLFAEHAERVKPPRMLSTPFSFGNALGRADDPEYQHQILKATLDLLDRPTGPVLEHLPDDMAPESLLQASEATKSPQRDSLSPADEVTALRAYYERWVETHDGRTAVGLSRIPQRRFRGIIRFLEAYINGEDTDTPDRPPEYPLPQFIRYCVDDLKAFYYEARMNQRPDLPDKSVHEWFWGETAFSALVVKLANHMAESEDLEIKAMSYGLAR